MATWFTVEEAAAEWVGAPSDDVLQRLLDVSKAECIAYAPVPEGGLTVVDGYLVESGDEVIPEGHRWAHLQHARNIWNASAVEPSGGFGAEGGDFVLRPFPIDWAIKQRLRPQRVFGGVTG